jgi:ribosomal protein L19
MGKFIYIISTCLLAWQSLPAQNAKEDLAAINLAMKPKSYSANVEYRSYVDKMPNEVLQSNIIVREQQYKITIGKMVKINSGKINLTIDHGNDVIAIAKSEKMDDALKNMPPLDSFVSRAQSIDFSKKDGVGTYTFILHGFREKSVEIQFDMASFQIRRIYIQMEEKLVDEDGKEHEQAVEIKYSSFNTDISISESVFSTDSYVSRKGKSFVASAKYRQYKIIDLIYNKE